MRRLARVPWVALALWAVFVLAGIEAAGVALGRWVLTPFGQVLACSAAAVFAVLVLLARAVVAEEHGKHSASTLAHVRAEALAAADDPEADIPEALRRRYYADGEVVTEEPGGYLDGPSFGAERRAYPGRPVPGGRRRTDPALPRRRRPRGGPDGH